jgi:hypothetical protein
MCKKTIRACAVIFAGGTAAHAQPIPAYDVTAACQTHPSMSERECVEEQYSYRWALSKDWAQASPAVQQECRSVADRFGDYHTLMTCLMAHRDDQASPATQAALPSPAPSSSPAPAEHAAKGPFEQGIADREAWESWFAGLNGDYRRGASYWSGQRSLAHPGPCKALGGEATAGCEAAKLRLDPSDARRKTDRDYRFGWNVDPSMPRGCKELVALARTQTSNALAAGPFFGVNITAYALLADDYMVWEEGRQKGGTTETMFDWSPCQGADALKVVLRITPEERARLKKAVQERQRTLAAAQPSQPARSTPSNVGDEAWQNRHQQTVEDLRYVLHGYVDTLKQLDAAGCPTIMTTDAQARDCMNRLGQGSR